MQQLAEKGREDTEAAFSSSSISDFDHEVEDGPQPISVTYKDYDDPFSFTADSSGAPHIFGLSKLSWVGCGEEIYVLECLGKGYIRVELMEDPEAKRIVRCFPFMVFSHGSSPQLPPLLWALCCSEGWSTSPSKTSPESRHSPRCDPSSRHLCIEGGCSWAAGERVRAAHWFCAAFLTFLQPPSLIEMETNRGD